MSVGKKDKIKTALFLAHGAQKIGNEAVFFKLQYDGQCLALSSQTWIVVRSLGAVTLGLRTGDVSSPGHGVQWWR